MQEDVFDAQLYFRLLSLVGVGELERMTQYKGEGRHTAHLLVYPVLMVHDVCGYDEILVGEDQIQHLELARELVKRYNRTFGADIKVPMASPVAGRVMSLTDPDRKMSKSEPQGCLFLDDTETDIRKKIRKAVADDKGRANLIELYRRLGGVEVPEMNLELKNRLSDLVVQKFPSGSVGFEGRLQP